MSDRSVGHDSKERHAPLVMEPHAFRRAGYWLVDRISEMIESLPDRHVTPGEGPVDVRKALDAAAPLPPQGSDAEAVLERAVRLLFDHSLFNGHPRFFGYITSSPAHIGILGDLLAAAVNANVGAWTLAPMATEIEAQTVRWIAELIGFPVSCGGLLVSGGNVANSVCFLAARAAKADWDVRARGGSDPDARPLRVYGSAETHTWIQKATDLAGLGTESIRWIGTDEGLRIDPDALRAAIDADLRAGDRPFLVIGTAGSVSTGAVDPVPELASICREYGLWFHVDGAYGALAAALSDAPPDLLALSDADSVAVDPHKWLYAPLEAGCALVRDPEHLRNAFSYHPPYYHFGVEATNYVDFGPQNSRGFRALKVWLALLHAGRSGYERMISDDIRLARDLYQAVAVDPEFEALTHGLSITTFRFVPADLRARMGEEPVEDYLNVLNKDVQARLERSGEAFVSNAVIRGTYALRACVVNFNSTDDDVRALPRIVARHGREADSASRPTELAGP